MKVVKWFCKNICRKKIKKGYFSFFRKPAFFPKIKELIIKFFVYIDNHNYIYIPEYMGRVCLREINNCKSCRRLIISVKLGWISGTLAKMNRWIDELMNWWIDELMNRWIDE